MRTSYSALDTYKTCPLKYKFAQIDKIKGEKSKEQVFGTAVHKALQFMFNRTPLFPTLDEVLNFYADYWGGAKDKIKVADKEKEFYLEEGKSILKKFFLKNPVLQDWEDFRNDQYEHGIKLQNQFLSDQTDRNSC